MKSVSHPALDTLVQRTDHGDIACLCLCNPPVNAINSAVRRALGEALGTVEQDAAIVGVVICAEGRLFSGGGDLREIGIPATADPTNMTALASRIEQFAKPVVAAMHGAAIGGGVLLAMGCSARVASSGASILLPEVKLAFTPGAGGTQRLPRLVGLHAALRMAALAQALDADAAHQAGFFDEVVQGGSDLLQAAVSRARAIAQGALPWRRTAWLEVPPLTSGETVASLAASMRAEADRVFPEREAAQVAIDLVLDAARTDFDTGMQREKLAYERLSSGSQARALIEQLLSERSQRKA